MPTAISSSSAAPGVRWPTPCVAFCASDADPALARHGAATWARTLIEPVHDYVHLRKVGLVRWSRKHEALSVRRDIPLRGVWIVAEAASQ